MKPIFRILFMSAALWLGCNGAKNAQQMTNTNPAFPVFDKEGHRGCRGLMPENTIPAMLHALQLGVTTLEMDIAFTKDGVAILSHEPFFNHEISTILVEGGNNRWVDEKSEKQFNIYEMSFAETLGFDVGLKPHPRFKQQQKMAVHKPKLADVIDSVKAWCQQRNQTLPFFNIETKTQPSTDNKYHPEPKIFVEKLLAVLRAKNIVDRCIIQSFDRRTLQYLHSLKLPVPYTALLIEDTDKTSIEQQLDSLGFRPTIYSPHFSHVNEALVNYCHRKQMKIIPWTVNDQSNIQLLKAMGVDGIITDYPNLFE
jgi:glycerophosphoryl diester phosphodiesterase